MSTWHLSQHSLLPMTDIANQSQHESIEAAEILEEEESLLHVATEVAICSACFMEALGLPDKSNRPYCQI